MIRVRNYTFIGAAVLLSVVNANATSSEARVTRVIREVNLLPADEKPRPAALNDKVSDDTAVRTGAESRSELTFVDLTITRLGANTIFSFNKAGRNVKLNSGSMLLRVPKDSGGARMSTDACSVAIEGTTVILETTRAGRNKLSVLEGGARMSLKKNRSESTYVRAGQTVDVPPGASKMPAPVDIDVDQVMNTNPLITDFSSLPSRDLIYGSQNQHIYQGQSVGRQPPAPPFIRPPIFPGISGVGNSPVYNPPASGTQTAGTKNKKKKLGPNAPVATTNTNAAGNQIAPGRFPNTLKQPTPTPTPRKKKNP